MTFSLMYLSVWYCLFFVAAFLKVLINLKTIGAGVIADTFPVAQRGRAYGIFYTGPLVGPVMYVYW